MKNLKPGCTEYQAQADFEYKIFHEGADGTAFPTIAGSGANGTMLHYDTNRDVCEDETLLLMEQNSRATAQISPERIQSTENIRTVRDRFTTLFWQQTAPLQKQQNRV